MTLTVSLLLGVALPLSLAYIFGPRPNRKTDPDSLPSALLHAYTSHARLLPRPARHAFTYPLLYIGVDVDALESGALDLPGRVLRYGGHPATKVLGLRPDGYLEPGNGMGLRSKLEKLLKGHEIASQEIGRVWLVTMPSFLGLEGINPLSVWYIYSPEKQPLCIVLEVHNTFGEKHAYVLKTDSEHLVKPNEGYDWAWIFPRSFHVSPFNSRDGYYRLDLLDPFGPLAATTPDIHPEVKIFLRLLTPSKEPKLQANLASHPTRRPVALDPANTLSILWTLARWPLALLLTTPRIMYQAWWLHYDKRLLIYPRPEPGASKAASEVFNPPQTDETRLGTAIGWQGVGTGEYLARRVVLEWAQKQADRTGISLIVDAGPQRPRIEIMPTSDAARSKDDTKTVRIASSDPKLFTNLLLAPSARHFRLLAPELLTQVSPPDLFDRFFSPEMPLQQDTVSRFNARRRTGYAYFLWSHSLIAPTPDIIPPPNVHFSDCLPLGSRLRVSYVLATAVMADKLEAWIMRVVKARFIEGQEPWKIWERALARQYTASSGAESYGEKSDLGSQLYNQQ